MKRVTLYGREGCHLCDRARALIEQISDIYPIELREVDIESDDALLSLYLERIPVIEVDGRIVSELVPDPDVLERALHTVAS